MRLIDCLLEAEASPKKNLRTIQTTAGALAKVLYNISAGELSQGHVYKGTQIPLRKVPEDAPVVLKAWSGGGSVEDNDGGWIADRFGPGLGHRAANSAMDKLQNI